MSRSEDHWKKGPAHLHLARQINAVRNLFGRAVLTVLDDASRLVLRQETRDDDALRGGRGRTVPTSRFGKIASSRADALFCDQVVERVDLRVEHFEVALAVGAVL